MTPSRLLLFVTAALFGLAVVPGQEPVPDAPSKPKAKAKAKAQPETGAAARGDERVQLRLAEVMAMLEESEGLSDADRQKALRKLEEIVQRLRERPADGGRAIVLRDSGAEPPEVVEIRGHLTEIEVDEGNQRLRSPRVQGTPSELRVLQRYGQEEEVVEVMPVPPAPARAPRAPRPPREPQPPQVMRWGRLVEPIEVEVEGGVQIVVPDEHTRVYRFEAEGRGGEAGQRAETEGLEARRDELRQRLRAARGSAEAHGGGELEEQPLVLELRAAERALQEVRESEVMEQMHAQRQHAERVMKTAQEQLRLQQQQLSLRQHESALKAAQEQAEAAREQASRAARVFVETAPFAPSAPRAEARGGRRRAAAPRAAEATDDDADLRRMVDEMRREMRELRTLMQQIRQQIDQDDAGDDDGDERAEAPAPKRVAGFGGTLLRPEQIDVLRAAQRNAQRAAENAQRAAQRVAERSAQRTVQQLLAPSSVQGFGGTLRAAELARPEAIVVPGEAATPAEPNALAPAKGGR